MSIAEVYRGGEWYFMSPTLSFTKSIRFRTNCSSCSRLELTANLPGSMDRKIPADPANPASQEVVEPQAGQVQQPQLPKVFFFTR